MDVCVGYFVVPENNPNSAKCLISMLLMKYMDSFKTHLAKVDEISGSDLTIVISCVFEQLAVKNDVKGFYRIPSVFDCREIPRISLREYLNRYVSVI